MQRLNGERGAVSVMVALLMIPLLGFAALSVDVAAIYADKQQLQTGADAGALAIAQRCSVDPPCAAHKPASVALANDLAVANKNDGVAKVPPEGVDFSTAGQVTVTAETTREHWFAPVLGVDQTAVDAKASVRWGAPSGGTAVLPLAFSLCEWQQQLAAGGGELPAGAPSTIKFSKTSGTTCTGPSGNLVPGGFGWLKPDAGTCDTTTAAGNILYSDPGSSVPSNCSTTHFGTVQNRTVLLPIFDHYNGSGTNAEYRIYGYAAFTVTGYMFGGLYKWNAPCSGSDRCIRGNFVEYVSVDDAFSYGAAPELGAFVARLVMPGG